MRRNKRKRTEPGPDTMTSKNRRGRDSSGNEPVNRNNEENKQQGDNNDDKATQDVPKNSLTAVTNAGETAGAEAPKSDSKMNSETANPGGAPVNPSAQDPEKDAKQSASLSQPPESAGAATADDDLSVDQIQQLRSLLQHRNLLLNRLQQGRSAVKRRLALLPPTTQTSDEEVISFRESLRQATSIARKNPTTEKRSNVSLRRGSSVGKRMNAALSSLGGTTAAAATASTGTVAATGLASSAPKSSQSENVVRQRSNSAVGGRMPQTAGAATRPTKQQALLQPAAADTAAQLSYQQQQQRIKRTVCPEAVALRERRSAILQKLAVLYEKRHRRSSDASTTSVVPPRRPVHFHRRLEPPPQQPLPKRRKTQWNYIMEEMRWLATDFQQERNWKAASGRLLAHSLQAGMVAKSRITLPDPEGATAEMDVEPEVETKTKEPSKPASKAASEILSEENSANGGSVAATSNDRKYEEVSEEDIEKARKVSKRLATDVVDFVTKKLTRDESPVGDSENVKPSEQDAEPNMDIENTTRPKKKEVLQNIANRIKEFSSKVGEGKPRRSGKPQLASSFGIELSTDQVNAVEHIEQIWGRIDSCGVVLSGKFASGKTMAASSLLWRHRNDGPSLIVAPPGSMIKWRHELGRFDDIQSHRFNKSLRAGSLGVGDVIICDIHSVDALVQTKASFHMLVVDCRFPNGFEASRRESWPPTILSTDSVLGQNSWWGSTILLAEKVSKRMLIESVNDKSLPSYASGLAAKLSLEVLAWRSAFLTGVTAPAYSKQTVGRLMLSWARQEVSDKKDETDSLPDAVRKCLLQLGHSVLVSLEAEVELNKALSENEHVTHSVRLCNMLPEQKSAYIRCCAETKTLFFPSTATGPKESLDVALALMMLRRHCMHSELHQLVSGGHSWFQAAMDETVADSSGPSQPSLDTAERILRGSIKLRVLCEFLCQDCGLTNEWTPDILRRKQNCKSAVRRVAILAALPEIQILASLLLKSLAIDHKIGRSKESSASGQSVLSWFNEALSEEDSVKIVILSLEVCAGDHGGLGVESADAVFVLDEHWSGREQLLLYAMTTRSIQFRKMTKSDPVQIVRLVAEDTCEANFLSETAPLSEIDSGGFSPTTKENGQLEIVSSPKAPSAVLKGLQPSSLYFVFPGVNILSSSGIDCCQILGFTSSTPLLTKREDVMFLSSKKGDTNGLDLPYRLMIAESKASKCRIGLESGPMMLDDLDHPITSYLVKVSGSHGSRNLAATSGALNSVAISFSAPLNATMRGDGEAHDMQIAPLKNSKETASETLFYNIQHPENDSKNRCNLYSLAYGNSGLDAGLLEGGHGIESLVYTPPLFPRILESSRLAKSDAELLRISAEEGASMQASDHKHVAEASAEGEPSAKKPRKETDIADASEMELFNDAKLNATDKSDASPPNDMSAVLDLSEDFGLAGIGAVPLPRDSALAAATSVVDTSSFQGGGIHRAVDTEEVERIRDDGSYPLRSMILVVSRKRPRSYSGRPNSQLSISSQGRHASSLWQGVGAPANGPNGFVNGVVAGRNSKKKTHGDAGSAFVRIPDVNNTDDRMTPNSVATGVAASLSSKSQELQKKSLLSSLRKSGFGTTLFDSAHYRMAAVMVKKRVASRLIRQCWTSGTRFEVGPGLPLLVAKGPAGHHASRNRLNFDIDDNHWTIILKRVGSSSPPGSEAIEISALQRAAFHASHVSPCRVDFGPFQCGFLSRPGGTTSTAFIRPRYGVSLPMGVKVSSHLRETLGPTWTTERDERLRKSLIQFGMNWLLVGRHMGDFREFTSASRPGDELTASRSCRDRWHTLVRQDATIVEVLERHEREQLSIFQRKAPMYEDKEEDSSSSRSPTRESEKPFGALKGLEDDQEVVPPSQDDDDSKSNALSLLMSTETSASQDTPSEEPEPEKPRRSLGALKTAKAKIAVPPTIQSASTSGAPAIVPSHTSHAESVRAAVAAAAPDIRPEMWPLQLLLARRRRENTSPAPNTHRTRTSPSRPPSRPMAQSFVPPPNPSSPSRAKDGAAVAPKK